MSKNITVLNHPLRGHLLLSMRDKNTLPNQFRRQAYRLGQFMAIESTRDLPTTTQSCETPMCQTTEQCVTQSIGLVPILRAGVGMVEPFLDFIPDAKTLFLGMYRDEETHEPVSYYNKLDESTQPDTAIILDPMLATGGSAILAIDALREWGVKNIRFVGLIGAPEGVKAVHDHAPEVDIYLAALDERLNDNAYIIPGLGDAGDRMFNTF